MQEIKKDLIELEKENLFKKYYIQDFCTKQG